MRENFDVERANDGIFILTRLFRKLEEEFLFFSIKTAKTVNLINLKKNI